jgi:LysM repeat protein
LMKTPFVIGIVVTLHVAAIGGIVLMQGCGSTDLTEPSFQTYEMPETSVPSSGKTPTHITPPEVQGRPASSPEWPAQTKLYVVQKGDSLSVISKRYSVSTSDIMRLNGLTNPNRIYVGQKLVLPGYVKVSEPEAVTPAAPAASPASSASVPAGPGGTYVIQRGDSLSVIAKRHHTSVDALRTLNGLQSDRINAGQKLKIPGAGSASSPSSMPQRVDTVPPSTRPRPEPQPLTPPIAEPSPADETPGAITPPDSPDPLFPEVPDVSPDILIEDEAVSQALIHTVKEGEDIYSIARIYGVLASEITKLNKMDSEDVSAGQKLKIP